jgi:hypothetical protein
VTGHCWIGAACDPTVAGGAPAHLDAMILSTMDECGLAADLVCTHVDRRATIATVTMSARVSGQVTTVDLAALAARLHGTAVALDTDGHIAFTHGESVDGAHLAAQAARAGSDGRCVRFPGQGALAGIHTVTEIVATSAIDDVIAIGTETSPGMMVDTRGYLRPHYQHGRLALLVEPAAGGLLRPVEIEQPHQCCGGH